MRSIFRRLLRSALIVLVRVLPGRLRYQLEMILEKQFFSKVAQVHELPDIFHYWSNRYIRPIFEANGFSNPDHFFEVMCLELAQNHTGQTLRLVSIGSGNCDLEVRLARFLLDHGITSFELECVDINATMLQRGKTLAAEYKVAHHLTLTRADFNHWQASGRYHGVIANQALHHVVELEHLFEQIRISLRKTGLLLVSDMIGRNGHMRWPEALAEIQQFWEELPDAYHYNHQTQRAEPEFVNRDVSTYGFEGIRAQDILPLLVKTFQFHTFLPYGNIIFPFVDRAFGPNFDAEDSQDRAFIDRVHARDETLMRAGQITPTAMVAALGVDQYDTRLRDNTLTPQRCIRDPES